MKPEPKPLQFWTTGPAQVRETGETVNVVNWSRPYGIPYATTADGREFHQDQLQEVFPTAR